MDVLSEILSTVRLQGALFFNAEFSAPWCLDSSGAAGIAPFIPSHAGPIIPFHFLLEGRAYAQLGSVEEQLFAGDIVILPRGDRHFLGNGLPREPVDSFRTFRKNVDEGLRLVRYGGGGEITRFVCGFMACDPRLGDLFLNGLPALLRVPVASAPSGDWIRNSIRFTVDTAVGSDAGSSLVVSRLSEVLFVETLRSYINALPENQTGWLAGARDASVGKALALLHKEPAHPWTVPKLAHHVGLSRTRLAERFRFFLGTSPMAYLTDWRLKLGAEILESSQHSVAQVADAVGYNSEAAFNRAFKRAFGCPPAKYRVSQKPATLAS